MALAGQIGHDDCPIRPIRRETHGAGGIGGGETVLPHPPSADLRVDLRTERPALIDPRGGVRLAPRAFRTAPPSPASIIIAPGAREPKVRSFVSANARPPWAAVNSTVKSMKCGASISSPIMPNADGAAAFGDRRSASG